VTQEAAHTLGQAPLMSEHRRGLIFLWVFSRIRG
jgi:hypothetical protein